MDTHADTEPMSSEIPEHERVRTCLPAVVRQGVETERGDSSADLTIVRGED
ncbi:hypothetical protein QFZ82_007021 [Streptomyces sp. V4I23]|uniref:hypothetical protein n=1 Tax=Streptomyces sp. V4I23 TaxID=3042282 RepID=UPI00277F9B24|nr:hypothetical protein [Streptomyces sp. V4I23]MDQ1012536.1 hypothetical protein [Streptomyces sp. V4I23]